MRGIRARLTATLVALVVLTAAVLGIGSYVFVDLSLHERLLDEAETQARFDLTAVIPERLPAEPTLDNLEPLLEILRQRGIAPVVDLDGGEAPAVVAGLSGALRNLPPGQLAYEWASIGGQPRLVVAGR